MNNDAITASRSIITSAGAKGIKGTKRLSISQDKVITKSTGKLKVLPKVAKVKSPKKGISPFGMTSLPCGEQVPKNHKTLIACGSLEETIGLIGKVKANYFNLEDTNSRKMFIFARLTKIQEDLLAIISSITTTSKVPGKHTNSRFASSKIQEVEDATTTLSSTPFTGVPGTTPLECDLYCVWANVRKCERQILSVKDPQLGIVVEESVVIYLNRLGDYFQVLITSSNNKFT